MAVSQMNDNHHIIGFVYKSPLILITGFNYPVTCAVKDCLKWIIL